jgi:N-acetylglutamate synthase-like GNAT family acetyltransferase
VAERHGDVLGYSTVFAPADTDDALHGMTCVVPSAGERLSAALVHELVVRARAAGLRRVIAWAIVPKMADVFAQLGFGVGDEIVAVRGPLL